MTRLYIFLAYLVISLPFAYAWRRLTARRLAKEGRYLSRKKSAEGAIFIWIVASIGIGLGFLFPSYWFVIVLGWGALISLAACLLIAVKRRRLSRP